MMNTGPSSNHSARLFLRAVEVTTTMRRRLTTCSAAALLGIAALAGGCMDPAALDELEDLDEAALEDLDADELDALAEAEAEDVDEVAPRDGAPDQLTAEPDPAASCALWSGYTAGSPSPTFPATDDPVVGFKPGTVLKLDLFGYYFEYHVELCIDGYGHDHIYYRYISGVNAGEWFDEYPFPGYDPI